MAVTYNSYTDFTLFAPQKLGPPTVRRFASAATTLSATANTVFDFTSASGDELGVNPGAGSYIPVACGHAVVDATSGNFVDYGQVVSQNAPDFNPVGRWNFRLTIPPTSGSPSVIVYAYITYFTVEAA